MHPGVFLMERKKMFSSDPVSSDPIKINCISLNPAVTKHPIDSSDPRNIHIKSKDKNDMVVIEPASELTFRE